MGDWNVYRNKNGKLLHTEIKCIEKIRMKNRLNILYSDIDKTNYILRFAVCETNICFKVKDQDLSMLLLFTFQLNHHNSKDQEWKIFLKVLGKMDTP